VALLEKTRLYLGLDASAVTAAAVGEGLGGRRVRGFARVPLGPGALAPSPSGPNLPRADEARAAIRRAVGELGGGRVTLVLPDGVARVALLELPEDAPPRDYVLFRLAASLPFPAGEAIVDALPAGGRLAIGAAVRRATVAEYEQSASGAGVEVERVHLAPLVALAGLMRAGARDAVHVVLGDVALCLAAFRGGVPAALRSRRRDRSAGEGSRLLEEASRVAEPAGDGTGPLRVVLSGAGAADLRHELGEEGVGRGPEAPGEWPGAAETAWLGGLVS
jgi:hypothetical protein